MKSRKNFLVLELTYAQYIYNVQNLLLLIKHYYLTLLKGQVVANTIKLFGYFWNNFFIKKTNDKIINHGKKKEIHILLL